MPWYRYLGPSGENPIGDAALDGRLLTNGEIVELTDGVRGMAREAFESIDAEPTDPNEDE